MHICVLNVIVTLQKWHLDKKTVQSPFHGKTVLSDIKYILTIMNGKPRNMDEEWITP